MQVTSMVLSEISFARVVVSSSAGVPLVQVLLTLVVVGILLWLVNRYIPMQSTIKSILNAIVVIAVVLWLLNIFGLLDSFTNIRVGR